MRVGTPFESTPVRAEKPCAVRAMATSSAPHTSVVLRPGWLIGWASERTSMTMTFAACQAEVSMPPMFSRSSDRAPEVMFATSTSSLSNWS